MSASQHNLRLEGVYTAIVTPFTEDGSLDLAAFGKLLDWQLEGGVSGVVVCGTTGESPTVSEAEFVQLLDLARKKLSGRALLIAGTGTNCTQTTITRSKLAREHGAQALLIASPYYNKPTQNGLLAHYHAVADAVDLPIIVYNVPGRTAVNITTDTLIVLARHPNIIAVKEASGDINQIMDVIQRVPQPFTVLAGDDPITLPVLGCGGRGTISVISNEAPALMVQMVNAALSGDFEQARARHYQLLPLMKANFWESNPTVVKAALAEMGLIKNVLRLPLVPMSPRLRTSLTEELQNLKLV
ncbi:MAG: 4-hydroxy-tetrahydrodipicolinate synthase [Candidatus Cyclonatronum sp.]|uniref:4-hydroxy-tetrahydrodipicolinate synthase n=1 Tax=Cyclonatronum sp. TaxID=3024185 RepID=UPI0025B8775E|nr:4-hydroxy-tetrahydrodipicolinate synthase [Cyclonatronum sp.]MCH8487796.1 4-hydroxy-tetrahydrodipicolinate synthase [Cyclonatronum sp.]